MDIDDYQDEAARTDNLPDEDALLVAFLGLGGEAGSLLTEYKKKMRDKEAHQQFTAAVVEELGDVLWYVSAVASRLGLVLSEVAENNLAKVSDRWTKKEGDGTDSLLSLPDESYPRQEQLPRELRITFEQDVVDGRKVVRLRGDDGEGVGDSLRNNAYEDDGYRFHDVMHLAHMAVLGWSPVFRKLLGKKRKSNRLTDEVEDGGRAVVIEEAIVAFVYDYAKDHALLEGVNKLDYTLLRTIKSLTRDLEVARWPMRDWESAILQGFDVWRALDKIQRGTVLCNLRTRQVAFFKS